VTDALMKVRIEGDEAVAGADRISQALGRIERGEPTRALRATRMAVDELATAATGLHPVLGRIASTFAEFGIGGAVGLASVAGFAAIGLEIKALAGEADALDAKLLKLNTTLAQGTNAAVLFAAQAHGAAADKGPGLWERLLGRFTFGEGDPLGGAELTVARQGRSSEAAGEQGAEARGLAAFRAKDRAAVQADSDALSLHVLALDKARLGASASWEQLDALAHREDELRLSRLHMNDETKRAILLTDDVTRAILHRNDAEEAARLERIRDFPFQNVTFDPNDIYNDARAANDPNQPTRPGRSQGEIDAENYRNAMLPSGGGGAAERAAAVGGDKIGAAVARTLAANLPSLVGALSRGDAGGFLSSAGGAVEGLSNLKGLSAAGPIGLVMSLVGGLFSLFSGGGAKVSVETISDKAAKQLRDAQGVPQNVQVYLVDANGNVKQVAARIQHSERMDASKRFVAA